jgi:hypothetical protein
MTEIGNKSIVFLDIETNSQLSQIHLCVTKELRSGEVKCHHKADTLLKMLEEQPQVVARKRTQPRKLGKQARQEEDRLQEGLAQDQQTLF